MSCEKKNIAQRIKNLKDGNKLVQMNNNNMHKYPIAQSYFRTRKYSLELPCDQANEVASEGGSSCNSTHIQNVLTAIFLTVYFSAFQPLFAHSAFSLWLLS